jgi:DNA-binding transcriptional LysR family regulator
MTRPSRRLSLEAIAAIDAIARHGSFSRAAAELNKVPSALSYTVTQLEQRLGVVLFDRSERRARLTEEGSDFLADGRWLLEVAGDVERRLAQRLTGWEAEVRLAVDTIFGLQSLYPMITAFDALYSGTRLSLREEAVSGCWDAIETDRADLVVAGLGAGGVPAGGGYQIDTLGSLSFVFAVAPGHPLARAALSDGGPLTDDAIRRHRAISVADTSSARPGRSVGLLKGQDVLTVASMRDKLAAQVAGLGVGFLPRFLAEPEIKAGRLIPLQVLQPRPAATFCVAYRQGAMGRAGKWIASQIGTTLAPYFDAGDR